MQDIRILSPCGMLGYGFPAESFTKGIELDPHAIIVDAGSTDAGPHKLGSGVPIVSRRAAKKDLEMMIAAAVPRKIPVIIGSAGGAGARKHVEWTLDIIEEILREQQLNAKLAVIWGDIEKSAVIKAIKEGNISQMGPNIPPLTEETVKESSGIVAQMGHEPIVEALGQSADIIVCGRAYDPSPFAALGIFYKKDPGLSYHLGKILECGALCAEPGTTKDCILGTIKDRSFTVKALHPSRTCTPISVAAHTFYEKEHPYILHGPGFTLDLEKCEYSQLPDGEVEVSNSRYIPEQKYFIKLEGARKTSYRTVVIAGIRDPLLIERLDDVGEDVKQQILNYYPDIPAEAYNIRFYHYGKDAVLGSKEPLPYAGHEIGLMIDVTAETQEIASSVCASVRSTFLHYGYEGRKSTAGNLAFPFAPSDIPFGPVYEFSVYHLMEISENPFKTEWREAKHEAFI